MKKILLFLGMACFLLLTPNFATADPDGTATQTTPQITKSYVTATIINLHVNAKKLPQMLIVQPDGALPSSSPWKNSQHWKNGLKVGVILEQGVQQAQGEPVVANENGTYIATNSAAQSAAKTMNYSLSAITSSAQIVATARTKPTAASMNFSASSASNEMQAVNYDRIAITQKGTPAEQAKLGNWNITTTSGAFQSSESKG